MQGFGYAAGFYGVFDVQLGEDFLTMTAYGMYADVEALPYLSTFQTRINQSEHFFLPLGQKAFVGRGGQFFR